MYCCRILDVAPSTKGETAKFVMSSQFCRSGHSGRDALIATKCPLVAWFTKLHHLNWLKQDRSCSWVALTPLCISTKVQSEATVAQYERSYVCMSACLLASSELLIFLTGSGVVRVESWSWSWSSSITHQPVLAWSCLLYFTTHRGLQWQSCRKFLQQSVQ